MCKVLAILRASSLRYYHMYPVLFFFLDRKMKSESGEKGCGKVWNGD